MLVDTSVWSLTYRRDSLSAAPQVGVLRDALVSGVDVYLTGVILLELFRGAVPSRTHARLAAAMASIPLVEHTRGDYIAAAELSNTCKRAGVQLGLADSLIAQAAISANLTLLTTDKDFENAAAHIPLKLWRPY